MEDGISTVVQGIEKLGSDGVEKNSRLRSIGIEKIYPNPEQPRQVFDPKALEDLAQTMRQLGQAQAITVRETSEGFEIISGERRYRAAKLAGLTQLDCVVKDTNDETSRLLSLVENVQREDLLPLEEALFLKKILEENPKMTLESLAKTLGSHKSTLSEKIKLCEIPEDLQKHLHRKSAQFTHRHWRVLSRLEDQDLLREYFLKAVEHQLSVVELEKALEALGIAKRSKRGRKSEEIQLEGPARQMTLFEERDGKIRVWARSIDRSKMSSEDLATFTQSVEALLNSLKSFQNL
jgi:ParB family transcriptional regulator, chromosome partitioning protein